MPETPEPQVWPTLRARDARALIRFLVEAFGFEEPKTKQAAELMEAIELDAPTLVVLPAPNLVVSRSFENLGTTKIILARNMNIRDLFTHTYVLLAKDSLELLEENFSKPQRPHAGSGEEES